MSVKYKEDIDDGQTKYMYDLLVIGGGSGGKGSFSIVMDSRPCGCKGSC